MNGGSVLKSFFPPEIFSRLSSHAVLMLNHLKADVILELVENNLQYWKYHFGEFQAGNSNGI